MRRTHIIDGNSEINTDGDSSYLFDSDSSGAFTEMFSDKKSFFMRDFDPRDGDTEISVGRPKRGFNKNPIRLDTVRFEGLFDDIYLCMNEEDVIKNDANEGIYIRNSVINNGFISNDSGDGLDIKNSVFALPYMNIEIYARLGNVYGRTGSCGSITAMVGDIKLQLVNNIEARIISAQEVKIFGKHKKDTKGILNLSAPVGDIEIHYIKLPVR
ncbi:hypothetical protein HN777_05235 [Candidatus Woesearchaeota archaeon]|nr:hypothetical protein [Candidatus Woesearchaeota archaeon]